MNNVTRRQFLGHLAWAAVPAGLIASGGISRAVAAIVGDTRAADEEIFLRKYDQASKLSLADRPFGELVAGTGMLFIGTPYLAHSLELPGEERLITNLEAFDCTTFVENVLALSRCLRKGERSFNAFKEQLKLIRYRSGTISGYPSRLHYFADWIADNEAKGIVRDVTLEAGGESYTKTLNFMSTHVSSYRQLRDSLNVQAIQKTEKLLSARSLAYIPKAMIPKKPGKIQSGDVIGIVTSVDGLDFSHVGLALETGGAIKFLHAPLSGGSVMVSTGSLAEYLKAQKGSTGVAVARPQQPS